MNPERRCPTPIRGVNLALLRSADLVDALDLSAAEGFNQTAPDWARLVRLEPNGCFCARVEDRLVGTVTTTTYGSEIAWIGMMAVHPDFRRRGIGAALMSTAISYLRDLGIPTIKLDATPAGRPLYESLGFLAESQIERWQGIAPPGLQLAGRCSIEDALQVVSTLDRAAFGANRSRLLECLTRNAMGEPLVAESDLGTPVGFALARLGRVATYIGPVVAGTTSVAIQLLDGMLVRLSGAEVCLDVHTNGLLEPDMLVQRGLSKRRGLTRMRRGSGGRGPAELSICASAGPELG